MYRRPGRLLYAEWHCVFLILTWAQTLLGIPFDLYGTFVIETRYGFNKTTPGLWLSDFFQITGNRHSAPDSLDCRCLLVDQLEPEPLVDLGLGIHGGFQPVHDVPLALSDRAAL